MSVSSDRITRTPDVCSGRACIAGHRVRVLDIAWYYDHREEVQEEIRAEREFGEVFRADHVSRVATKGIHDPLKEAS